ncbi:hypothetical protein B9Z55_015364 [Caenorhabditis nigoni]|uniref:Domain of unknown function WSN domain-containing protein n=1 Tax=Caenorhabditis nigoni TaxID=1611254 RepID=A0A2G5U9V0_9PELO|nr:hypothetical protein B9Z55_015364 [Caenorhabditis nigoni]
MKEFLHNFNSVIIENALADGTITKTDVARELLNIPYDIDLEKLRTENVAQVGNELEEVFSKVSEGCATAGNPCEGLDVVRNGITFIHSMARTITMKCRELFASHSSLAHAVWLSAVPTEIENYRKMLKETLDSFENPKSYQDLSADEVASLILLYTYKRRLEHPIAFLEQAAAVHKAGSLHQETLESEIDNVITLKATTLGLKNEYSFEESQKKLKSIAKLAENTASVISTGSVDPLIRKMHSFVLVNNLRFFTIKERNFTHGFYNGGHDYVEYFDNLDSRSSENNVLLNSPRESLKNYLVHSSALSKEIKPSLEVFFKLERV